MADAIGRLQELARELKRRGVVRVFVIYVAAGFVVLQAVQLLVPLLLLPDWVSRLVLVLLLAGLPVALVLGWAYDLTPEGVQPAGPQARSVEAVEGPDRDAAAGGARAVAAGDALYYRSPDGDRVYRVAVSTGGAESAGQLTLGVPRVLFEGRFYSERPWGRMYDLHPDGDRFLMLQFVTEGSLEAGEEEEQGLCVVLGWLADVRRQLATGGG